MFKRKQITQEEWDEIRHSIEIITAEYEEKEFFSTPSIFTSPSYKVTNHVNPKYHSHPKQKKMKK